MNVTEADPRGAWTDDRIALLKQYWTDGHSCSQIAGMLGWTSRNAVIGKVHRLGLAARIEGTFTLAERRKRDVERKKRECGTRTEYFQDYRKRFGAKKFINPRPPRQPKPKLSETIMDAPEPELASTVTLLEITRQQCRWVIGEPKGFETLFCGAVTIEEQSYCPHHYRRTRTGDAPRYTGPRNHKKASQVIWAGCP